MKKNLLIFCALFCVLFSCSTEDNPANDNNIIVDNNNPDTGNDTGNNNSGNDDTNPPVSDDQGVAANINGGTFNNFQFQDSVYQVNFNTDNNTITIDVADDIGNQLTIFLNSTGGFDKDTVKTMGDTDVNNFVTYILIRQQSPQLSYFSSSGSATITANRPHPDDNSKRLISGTFSINASTTDNTNSTSMTGTFTDLEF